MPPLFADDISAGAFAGITGGIVTLLGGVWMIVRQFFGDRAAAKAAAKKEGDEADKVKRVDTIAELQGMMATLRADFAEHKKESRADQDRLEKELDEQRVKGHDCDRKTDRMSAHIFYLEETIRRAGIVDFRPWAEVEAGAKPVLILSPAAPKEPK